MQWEEFDGSLSRLVAAGHVQLQEGLLDLTPLGRSTIARLSATRVLDRQDELAIVLGVRESSVHDPSAPQDPGKRQIVARSDYDAAVARYTRNPSRTLDGK